MIVLLLAVNLALSASFFLPLTSFSEAIQPSRKVYRIKAEITEETAPDISAGQNEMSPQLSRAVPLPPSTLAEILKYSQPQGPAPKSGNVRLHGTDLVNNGAGLKQQPMLQASQQEVPGVKSEAPQAVMKVTQDVVGKVFELPKPNETCICKIDTPWNPDCCTLREFLEMLHAL